MIRLNSGGFWTAHSKIYGGSRSIWTQYVTGLAVHHNEIHGMWDADGHSGPSNLVSPMPLRDPTIIISSRHGFSHEAHGQNNNV